MKTKWQALLAPAVATALGLGSWAQLRADDPGIDRMIYNRGAVAYTLTLTGMKSGTTGSAIVTEGTNQGVATGKNPQTLKAAGDKAAFKPGTTYMITFVRGQKDGYELDFECAPTQGRGGASCAFHVGSKLSEPKVVLSDVTINGCTMDKSSELTYGVYRLANLKLQAKSANGSDNLLLLILE